MLNALTICAIINLAVSFGGTESSFDASRASTVRIGLFSLFKPESLNVRVTQSGSAIIETEGAGGQTLITAGDRVRLRLKGARVDVIILDSLGRIKRSVNTVKARIVPQDMASLELTIPGRMKREVRGQLSVTESTERQMLQITLATDIESAVASVTAAEMSGLRQAEAIKALSVIARTYMLSHAGRHSEEGFDFCDTTHCQLYRGEADLAEEADSPLVASAVEATAGQWLSFENEPVEVYFTAVCGGITATPEMVWGGTTNGGYEYRRIECRWCNKSHYINWARSALASKVIDALSVATRRRLSSDAEMRVERDEASGLTLRVFVRDRGHRIVMTADEFRRAVGRALGWNRVLSGTFGIERRGERIIFRGRGFGSQVGLCLIGAVAQAEAGRSYKEILSFYFPRSEIAESGNRIAR